METNYEKTHWQITCSYEDTAKWEIALEYLMQYHVPYSSRTPIRPSYSNGAWYYKVELDLYQSSFVKCDRLLKEFTTIGLTNLTAVEVA